MGDCTQMPVVSLIIEITRVALVLDGHRLMKCQPSEHIMYKGLPVRVGTDYQLHHINHYHQYP
jgi:hypothetical protein